MRIAHAPRRWTARSNAPEIYPRIFADRSWAAYTKDLARAGVDGASWQTSMAILPPLEGLLLHARDAEGCQGRQMCVRQECPMGGHGASQQESKLVFDAQLGSSDVLREGRHTLP